MCDRTWPARLPSPSPHPVCVTEQVVDDLFGDTNGGAVRCGLIDTNAADEPNEFIRGPKWRTRTTAGRRGAAAALTFAMIWIVGLVLLIVIAESIGGVGGSGWVRWLPWLVPTIGVVVWTLARPTPAELTDDDDDSWTGFAIRYVLVGLDDPRPAVVRLLAALVFGAPVVWSLILLGLASIVGIV